jgi:hypothetical protein
VSREVGTSWENRPLAGPSLRACSRRSVSLVNPLDRDTAAGPGGSSARSGRELRFRRWVEARILDGSYLRRCVFDFGQIADLGTYWERRPGMPGAEESDSHTAVTLSGTAVLTGQST